MRGWANWARPSSSCWSMTKVTSCGWSCCTRKVRQQRWLSAFKHEREKDASVVCVVLHRMPTKSQTNFSLTKVIYCEPLKMQCCVSCSTACPWKAKQTSPYPRLYTVSRCCYSLACLYNVSFENLSLPSFSKTFSQPARGSTNTGSNKQKFLDPRPFKGNRDAKEDAKELENFIFDVK